MLQYNPDVIFLTDICSPGFGRYAGTYRCATELRDKGYEVQVVEFFCRYTTEQLKHILTKFITRDTLWIGVSTTFLQPVRYDQWEWGDKDKQSAHSRITGEPVKLDKNSWWHSVQGDRLAQVVGRFDWPEIVDHIRHLNPDCKIVFGGAKAGYNVFPDPKEDDKYVDIRMVGQSENSLIEVTHALEQKKRYSKVMTRPYDDFPQSRIRFLDHDLIFDKEALPIEIARGCIFKCSFCAFDLNGKKMWEYNRSPENIRKELQYAYDKWGTTGWMFSTDTYNDSPKKVKMFHDEFNKMDHKIDFSSYARLDMMLTRPETIKLCYDTGLRSVLFGVETFNQKAGKALGKGMDPVRQQEGLYRIREECPDLIIGVAMIAGLQHDTEEILRKNNEWFLKPDCPVDAITYNPLWIDNNSWMAADNTTAKSKMQIDPMYYGYELLGDGEWIRESDGLTRKRCRELCDEFSGMFDQFSDNKDMELTSRGTRNGSWQFYSRLKNLGYSLEDLRSNKVVGDEMIKKEDRMKAIYHERLLAL